MPWILGCVGNLTTWPSVIFYSDLYYIYHMQQLHYVLQILKSLWIYEKCSYRQTRHQIFVFFYCSYVALRQSENDMWHRSSWCQVWFCLFLRGRKHPLLIHLTFFPCKYDLKKMLKISPDSGDFPLITFSNIDH